MNAETNSIERVIGFDSHPDSFTAAILRGQTPAAAIVEKTFNKVPLGQLQNWAKKNTTAQDLLVLEASGNSFQVVRILAAVERLPGRHRQNRLGAGHPHPGAAGLVPCPPQGRQTNHPDESTRAFLPQR